MPNHDREKILSHIHEHMHVEYHCHIISMWKWIQPITWRTWCVNIEEINIWPDEATQKAYTNLYISFCSFYPLIPHIANKRTPSFGNRISHRKSTVINDMLKHKISLLTRTCWRSMVNLENKIEQTSSNSDSCWTWTILLYARS